MLNFTYTGNPCVKNGVRFRDADGDLRTGDLFVRRDGGWWLRGIHPDSLNIGSADIVVTNNGAELEHGMGAAWRAWPDVTLVACSFAFAHHVAEWYPQLIPLLPTGPQARFGKDDR